VDGVMIIVVFSVVDVLVGELDVDVWYLFGCIVMFGMTLGYSYIVYIDVVIVCDMMFKYLLFELMLWVVCNVVVMV